MQSSNFFQNESFKDRVDWLRRNIADVAFFIVALSYVGAAVAIGTFVTKLLLPAFGVTAANVMGYGLAFGAQLGRGTVLFFGQGNPIRVHVHRWNWTIAVAMGFFSIWEVYHLVAAAGIHLAAFWTFAGAMIIGVIVEILLAAEVDRFTKLELFRNEEAWKELQEYHQGEIDFRQFLREIKRGNTMQQSANRRQPAPPAQPPANANQGAGTPPPAQQPNTHLTPYLVALRNGGVMNKDDGTWYPLNAEMRKDAAGNVLTPEEFIRRSQDTAKQQQLQSLLRVYDYQLKKAGETDQVREALVSSARNDFNAGRRTLDDIHEAVKNLSPAASQNGHQGNVNGPSLNGRN